MVSDIAGFVASTYLRGVTFGFVPTTLLGPGAMPVSVAKTVLITTATRPCGGTSINRNLFSGFCFFSKPSPTITKKWVLPKRSNLPSLVTKLSFPILK